MLTSLTGQLMSSSLLVVGFTLDSTSSYIAFCR
ncbi:hypothetical protein Gotri_009740 [Gossypium trilobum]|uniref:Uncharacterized protein n=1 Tax=Gossypium trilobum TaxID=34281 RepID=A0A7J9ENW5_9ROSI|nr:hypothetical protein [Gossypium trilobum]